MSIYPISWADVKNDPKSKLIHDLTQFVKCPEGGRRSLHQLVARLEEVWANENQTFRRVLIETSDKISRDEYDLFIDLFLEAVADAPVKLERTEVRACFPYSCGGRGVNLVVPEEKALPFTYRKKVKKLIRERMPEKFA
jgi:hypothetical protein